MAKVSPYYSSKNPGVYHVCQRCPKGNKIESEHRKSGSGGGRLCLTCRQLQKQVAC